MYMDIHPHPLLFYNHLGEVGPSLMVKETGPHRNWIATNAIAQSIGFYNIIQMVWLCMSFHNKFNDEPR